jgi:hypothetical protein
MSTTLLGSSMWGVKVKLTKHIDEEMRTNILSAIKWMGLFFQFCY